MYTFVISSILEKYTPDTQEDAVLSTISPETNTQDDILHQTQHTMQ